VPATVPESILQQVEENLARGRRLAEEACSRYGTGVAAQAGLVTGASGSGASAAAAAAASYAEQVEPPPHALRLCVVHTVCTCMSLGIVRERSHAK
jgi:hypothetical protein